MYLKSMTAHFEAGPESLEKRISIPEDLIESSEKREIVQRITSGLIEEMNIAYGPEGFDPLPFHNPEHPVYVGATALNLYHKIVSVAGDIPQGVVESDSCAIAIASAGHDLYIETKPIEKSVVNGVSVRSGTRVRLRNWIDEKDSPEAIDHRGNEYKSAQATISEVRKHDYGGVLLGKDVLDKISYGVKVTLPEVEVGFVVPENYREIIDPSGHRVDLTPYLDEGSKAFRISQKFNTASTPLAAMCIGLADLSYVGHLVPEQATERADAEYREVHVGIVDRLQKIKLEELTNEEKKGMVSSMLGWMKSQIQFGVTQKYNFDNVIDHNLEIRNHAKSDEIKSALREEYTHFDEYIAYQIGRYKRFVNAQHGDAEIAGVDNQVRDLAGALGIVVKE